MNNYSDFGRYNITGINKLILCYLLLPIVLFSQSSWYQQYPVIQNNALMSINFADNNIGIAVGIHGTILRTTDCGERWRETSVDISNDLNSVCFSDSNNGIICGSGGLILKTTDAGIAWFKINTNIDLNFRKVAFADKNKGWIIGESGTILKTTDGGYNWIKQMSNLDYDIYGLAAYDSSTCFVSGKKNLILKTTNSGNSWNIIGNFISNKIALYSFCIRNKDTLYAAGVDMMLYSYDGGNNWKFADDNLFIKDLLVFRNSLYAAGYDIYNQKSYNRGGINIYHDEIIDFGHWFSRINVINSMTKIKDDVLFAAGENGIIYRYKSWNNPCTINGTINDICLFDENNWIVCRDNGQILETMNSGQVWNTIYENDSLNYIKFSFPKDIKTGKYGSGYMLAKNSQAYKILFSSDYGKSWKTVLDNLYGIRDINFYNSFYGTIAGIDGTIITTSDGGKSWQKQNNANNNQYNSVFEYDSFVIVAVGENGIITRTEDGGKTWISKNIDFDYNLNGVWFTDSKNGFIIGITSNGSVILNTQDGGKTWNKINQTPINYLYKIYFTNPKNGYIIGRTHLYSFDGGNSWGENQNIFGTSVSFTNSKVGCIVNYDGTLFKTTNGGLLAEKQNLISNEINLSQNYPNPFNPSTVISYSLEAQGLAPVQIKIYDILGRVVKTLIDEYKPAGEHKVTFEAKGLGSGIYFYKLDAGGKTLTRKMILIR